MTTLQFTGARLRPFTVVVNGHSYYVQPGQSLVLPAEDAAVLVERDPQLWAVVEDKPRKVKD